MHLELGCTPRKTVERSSLVGVSVAWRGARFTSVVRTVLPQSYFKRRARGTQGSQSDQAGKPTSVREMNANARLEHVGAQELSTVQCSVLSMGGCEASKPVYGAS